MSTVRHLTRRVVLAAGLFLLAGCMADPMPSPGAPDRSRILLSAATAVRGEGGLDLVAVVGLDDAVEGAGFVEIRQTFGETRTVVRSGASGTFAAVVNAAVNDPLIVTFRALEDGPASNEVSITVAQYDGMAQDAPETPAAVEPGMVVPAGPHVSAGAPADGRSQVEGGGFGAGVLVVLGNTRTGEVVEVTTDQAGAFTTTVGARAGDQLVALVRTAGGATSGAAALAVPVP